jgi:hypothetical protein
MPQGQLRIRDQEKRRGRVEDDRQLELSAGPPTRRKANVGRQFSTTPLTGCALRDELCRKQSKAD